MATLSNNGGANLPRPTPEALRAYRQLTYDLSQWAPTVHKLVRERIAALVEANGDWNTPLETAEEHAERVLAHGQYPFPAGECLYDDLHSNTAYEHIEVGYGTSEDDGFRIELSGWYPHWTADRTSYERRSARIHCPGWLVTDPNGVDRFRRETQAMAETVRRANEAERALISARLRALHETRNNT